MRTRKTSANGLTVQVIAGTFVVMLGFNVSDKLRKGLLGFAIQRTDLTEKQQYWLAGGITFAGQQPDPKGMSTLTSPVQRFLWGDYTAKPSHHYTYVVQAMYGKPGALTAGENVTVDVQTEDSLRVGGGKHQVHFNRSAAASQAYVRMFGNADPKDVPNGAAYRWISRGLEESLIAFIERAADKTYSLHLSVYEFQKDNFLEALRQAAVDRKVHVEIIYDGIPNPNGPHVANEAAIKKHQLGHYCRPRTNIASISHHKFMVLSQNNKPLAVWTGSTNFTDGAIYGQANVGHAIEDSALATQFLQLHQQLLSKDPNITESRQMAQQLSPVPPPAAQAKFYPIFSPRSSLVAIDICAKMIHNAKSLVCFTAPFGLDAELNDVLDDPKNTFLSFGLLNTADNKIEATRRTLEDRFVTPAQIKTKFDDFQAESLHHKGVYIHTKSIMIDPFSDNPVVVTGSANFSRNSSENNDENQLIISNEPAVSDVYLGEFMRMYDHYLFRDLIARTGKAAQDIHLAVDDSWTDKYFVTGLDQQERLVFSGN